MNEKYKHDILLIAHRGASKIAPENTLKAFQKAIELEADYVEFDVHQSKDGEVVIMHDANTFRTTRHLGAIKNMTLKELKELNAGEGEQIPTLQELIELAKGKINFQLEIKDKGMAKKIVTILKDADVIESTLVSSFKHKELLEAQKIEPRLKLAALIIGINTYKIIKNAVKNKFNAIQPFYTFIRKSFIDSAHRNNIKINAWTVNSKETMRKLSEMGVDGIITNDVEVAKEILNRK